MTEYALVDPSIHKPKQLNQKGRCCGVKPLKYLRDRHFFCCRCDRSYSLDTGAQIENWAWRQIGDGFQSTTKRKVSA
jgi:hypothetical protein